MAVIRKEEKDGIVECLIDSSNIIMSEYDESKKTLVITFKAGTQYKYFDVLHRDYVRFEISESQGSVFNKTMKNYKYEKLDKVDVGPLKEEIENIKNR
jgi:hypothetical protein